MSISIIVIIVSTLALVLNTVFQPEDNSSDGRDCKNYNGSITSNSSSSSKPCTISGSQEGEHEIFIYTEAICIGRYLNIFCTFSN